MPRLREFGEVQVPLRVQRAVALQSDEGGENVFVVLRLLVARFAGRKFVAFRSVFASKSARAGWWSPVDAGTAPPQKMHSGSRSSRSSCLRFLSPSLACE
jgi:hypothetical protein